MEELENESKSEDFFLVLEFVSMWSLLVLIEIPFDLEL